MKRILTCTDGSSYAHSIYHYSAWAAKRLEAEIHVLHMLDPLPVSYTHLTLPTKA